MRDFPKNTTLTDAQNWIEEMCKERGFDKNPPLEIFLRFTEEVGELAKAIRKVSGMRVEGAHTKEEKEKELRGEFADVAQYLFDLANTFGVNLEEAIREKDEINKNRTWK